MTHYVEVSGAFFVERLDVALALDKLHLWSLETVKKRFEYREPGLYVLAARVYRIPQTIDVPHKPEYDGCKTWVEFDDGFSTAGATPVIESRRYADFLEELDSILNPRAFA